MTRTLQYRGGGFTLIEIQIAIALLILIVMLGYSSLHLAGRSWQATETGSARMENERLIGQFLRRQLEQSVPLLLVEDGKRELQFEGARDQLRFIGRLPAHRGGGGLHVIRIGLSGNTLTFSYQPLVMEYATLGTLPEAVTVELLTDIAGIELAYYGSHTTDTYPAWHNDWRKHEQPPELIRLRIRPQNAAPWPDLIAAHYARAANGRPELVIHGRNDG
jgi:general secretion pathway protein J